MRCACGCRPGQRHTPRQRSWVIRGCSKYTTRRKRIENRRVITNFPSLLALTPTRTPRPTTDKAKAAEVGASASLDSKAELACSEREIVENKTAGKENAAGGRKDSKAGDNSVVLQGGRGLSVCFYRLVGVETGRKEATCSIKTSTREPGRVWKDSGLSVWSRCTWGRGVSRLMVALGRRSTSPQSNAPLPLTVPDRGRFRLGKRSRGQALKPQSALGSGYLVVGPSRGKVYSITAQFSGRGSDSS